MSVTVMRLFCAFALVQAVEAWSRSTPKSVLVELADRQHEVANQELSALVKTVDPPAQTVTHESWLSRMEDSIYQFILGCVLLVFSVPVLWVSESRAAKMETLINYAQEGCRRLPVAEAAEENMNSLVHIDGADMTAAAQVADTDFEVRFPSDCIRLRRTVEVYQMIQKESKETKEKLGGGKETVTTYTYERQWSSTWHDSSKYEDLTKRVNTKPDGLVLGISTQNCDKVLYGKDFVLPQGLVEQCVSFRNADQRIGDSVAFKAQEFKKQRDGFYYLGTEQNPAQNPYVGDARVCFEYVPDGLASVVALQVESPGKNDVEADKGLKSTFLPYRNISRGWFGISDEEEKQRLRKEGEKSNADLANEASLSGILSCLCCAYNLVSMCFHGMLAPEIFHLFGGKKNRNECFQEISARARFAAWAGRCGGWVLMFIGLYSLFAPFLTLIVILPWIGPFLSKVGGAAIWFLCGITTLLVSTLIAGCAYLVYRPLLGLCYLGGALVILAIPYAYSAAVGA